MTVLPSFAGGVRRRGVAPPDVYAAAPLSARDPERAGVVHWLVVPEDQDPVIAGAHWALAQALDSFFGPVLGAAFFDEITDLEEWDGSQWVPLA